MASNPETTYPETTGIAPGDGHLASIDARAEQAAALLAALGQTKRLMGLTRLLDREMAVGPLAAAIGLGHSALSQHLARLRDLGIVTARRDGQNVFYRLTSDEARRMLELVRELYGD